MLTMTGLIWFALLSGSGGLAQTPTAPPPPVCTSPEHRQFDFWVGQWEVYATGTDRLVARSRIERLYDGCAIRENWMPVNGAGGGSLSSYRPAEREWRQIWADSRNGWVEFRGGYQQDAMVITGIWPGMAGADSRPLVRMRYSRGAGGTVRQAGEMSTDGGATWTPSFDFTYRPAVAAR